MDFIARNLHRLGFFEALGSEEHLSNRSPSYAESDAIEFGQFDGPLGNESYVASPPVRGMRYHHIDNHTTLECPKAHC